jgi:hypothetical protein
VKSVKLFENDKYFVSFGETALPSAVPLLALSVSYYLFHRNGVNQFSFA